MPYMEQEGVEFTYASFEDEELHRIIYTHGNYLRKAKSVLRASLKRLGLLTEVKNYDVVFLFEEASRLGPAFIERLITRIGVPIVYDFCDPIWMPYKSPTNKYLSYLKCFGKTATICKLSSHVLAGNKYVADYARQFNSRVTIVPLTIDTVAYTEKTCEVPRDAEPPVIGWSGSHSTVWHLDGFRDVLQKLRAKRPYKLRVVGTASYQLDGVDVLARPWRAETEVADLKEFDIGMMPLPDDPWVRLRTQLKVRQYMGLGIPCVASAVGIIPELIQDGVNGSLASTEAEWIDKLSRLIDDPELRRRLGAAGRKTIEERYSAKLWAPRVLEIMRSVSRISSTGSAGPIGEQ
jgi:glycosyltransferase involved in cell wall biosynthesis